jgi:hypothetical protein|tara:strand:+ start:428 stop:748 length:321 start_codon:yes stop_codon:yes gene_type:complete
MRKTKELDHHLKHIINQVPISLEKFENNKEKKITYYTGNWATDVMNNFTEKQSEKIFKKMNKIMNNNPNIMFLQKRMKPIKVGSWSEYGEQEPYEITGFEYIAIKR